MEINGNELRRMKLNQDEPTVKNISENESTNKNQSKIMERTGTEWKKTSNNKGPKRCGKMPRSKNIQNIISHL